MQIPSLARSNSLLDGEREDWDQLQLLCKKAKSEIHHNAAQLGSAMFHYHNFERIAADCIAKTNIRLGRPGKTKASKN